MFLGTCSCAVVGCVLCALSGFAAPCGHCGLAPVRVPWLWPAACLSGVPRCPAWCAAPRPVRSLSVLRSAFPTPWCLSPPPALLGGCAGHVEAGRGPGSLCPPLAPAKARALLHTYGLHNRNRAWLQNTKPTENRLPSGNSAKLRPSYNIASPPEQFHMAVLTWLCHLFSTFTHLHADGAEIYIEEAQRRVHSNTRPRSHLRPLCFSLLRFSRTGSFSVAFASLSQLAVLLLCHCQHYKHQCSHALQHTPPLQLLLAERRQACSQCNTRTPSTAATHASRCLVHQTTPGPVQQPHATLPSATHAHSWRPTQQPA